MKRISFSDLTPDERRFLDAWHNATPAARDDVWLLLTHLSNTKPAEPAEIVPFPSGDQHAEGDTNG